MRIKRVTLVGARAAIYEYTVAEATTAIIGSNLLTMVYLTRIMNAKLQSCGILESVQRAMEQISLRRGAVAASDWAGVAAKLWRNEACPLHAQPSAHFETTTISPESGESISLGRIVCLGGPNRFITQPLSSNSLHCVVLSAVMDHVALTALDTDRRVTNMSG